MVTVVETMFFVMDMFVVETVVEQQWFVLLGVLQSC